MELTSKQRAQLRGLANSLTPIVHIGKEGITEAVVKQTDEALERLREDIFDLGKGGITA